MIERPSDAENEIDATHFDVSGWPTRLTDAMIARFTAADLWSGGTLAGYARERALKDRDRIAVVDGRGAMTFGDVFAHARQLAAGLTNQGLLPGDVISFQLPNWHEAMIINLAASLGGFVCNPIVPIYRDAEVGFILNDARTKILFITDRFRSIDYIAMVERLRPSLPALQKVVLVRGERDGYASLEELISDPAALLQSSSDPAENDANAVKLLLYTSGTTGKPKGVLHSHNTLGAEIKAVVDFWAVSWDDVILMPSPVTHITGYLYALELPFRTAAKTVLMETWQADEAVRLIDDHGATVSIGATPFLVELSTAAERAATRLPSLRLFACGGAPVAPEIVTRARQAFAGCIVCRVFGSSEAPTISLGIGPSDPAELGAWTDGRIVNHDVRIVDAISGEVLGIEMEGEILTRGPEVMVGYTDPAETAAAFDGDGFFHTGDLGSVSGDGYITISGRAKDLIIRGGENISPKEIEDVLHRHPHILDAAVVAMPHPRMGETPVCYVVLQPDRDIQLPEIKRFLEAEGLAKQKFPERAVVLAELPRTATGKVLKHVLRAQAKRL